jgi:glycosyltransferase involved in cell wall biosynthesis
MYLELVKLLGCKSRIVVSERSSYLAEKSGLRSFVQRVLHVLADVVVVNSDTQGAWLASKFSWLKGKIKLLYNGIEIDKFSGIIRSPDSCWEIKLLAVGRVEQNKNLLNLIKALIIFNEKKGWVPEVKWVGRRDEVTALDREYCSKVDDLLESNHGVKEKWIWMGERSDVPDLLGVSDALIHPSFSEGLPNVICEGLASSLPVLCSNICDNGLLVEDGKRGFTFDPFSPEEICESLEKLAGLKKDEWLKMSQNSRDYAENNLSMERLVFNYENLFKELTSKAGA